MTTSRVNGILHTRSARMSPLIIPTTEHPNPSAALCFVSPPLPTDVSALQFHIVSHDQGWCEDSQDRSWSWFEVSIFRPFQPELKPKFPDVNEMILLESHPEDFGAMIQELGFYFADIPRGKAEPGNIVLPPVTSLFLTSNTVNPEWEHHLVTWTLGQESGEGTQFLSLLEEGDRVAVWARAQFPAWMNFVKEVELFIPASNTSIVESQQAEKLDELDYPMLQLLHRRSQTAQLSASANSKGKERLESAERRIQNPVIILSSSSGGSMEDGTPTHPVIHHGVFCDGPSCMKYPEPRPIEGARYKCMKCVNKDFCLDCVLDEANPHEKMHPLMKCTTQHELSNWEHNLKGKKWAAPRERNPITKPHKLHIIRVECGNQITRAIIKDVLPKKQKNVNSTQDPEVREMVRDLRELMSKCGKMDWETLQQSSQVRDRYDEGPLSDEEMDRISVSFVFGDSPAPDNPPSPQVTLDEHKAWSEYKHHQFIRRWGLLSQDEGRDEEWWITDPVVLDENEPSYLCEMCRHINFNVLLTQRGLPGNQEPGPTRIGLYSLTHVLRNHPCAFCLLLRKSFSEKGFPGDSCPDDFEGQTIMLTVLDEGPKYALRLEVSLGVSVSQAAHDSVAPIVIQWVGETSEQPLRALPVRPDMANLTRLKSWMDMCDSLVSTSGGTGSAGLAAKESILLRFIDLNENRIVTAEATCRYACLSYVWGGVSQTQYTSSTKVILEARDGLLDPSLTLPHTIRDTMKAARAIGFCYLWVDALCILQDSKEDVAKNVTMMDEIYSGAALTIVASTNVNPHYGLPGVSTSPRSRMQITQTVQGMCLSTAFHDPRRRLDDIENSIWNTRAWTYQERHLSSRSVYFTDSEMVFICPFGTFFEDTVPAMGLDYKPSPVNEGFNCYPRGVEMQIWDDPTQRIYPNKSFRTDDQTTTMVAVRPSQDGGHGPCSDPSPIYRITRLPGPHLSGRLRDDTRGLTIWDVYVNAVKNYTQRNLTFDADAVNAFVGMATFIAKGVNTKFWFGIPEFAFDRALLWYPRETLERRRQGDRALFPSWSWSAWKGGISYRCKGWHNAQYHGPASVIDWYSNMTLESFVERYPVDSQSGLPMREFIEERNVEHFLSALDSRELMKIVTPDDGWVAQMDEESNDHYYTHEEYPGTCFSYPVNLPGQEIVERPDPEGMLCFKSSTVRTRLCDMSISKFTAEPPKDHFIQIGTNDEKRSANYRAPWQRILYHQGYRCGFLVLNISFDELESASEDQYYLAAISRECLPEIPDPGLKGEMYKALDPRQAQHFLYKMRHDENMETPYSAPDAEALPDTTPRAENGDPFWDEGRFSMSMTHPVYNVLLLKKDGKFSERVGVGKMHFHAFHLAHSSDALILLR